MKRKGFTLIELLAVILILGIIALIAIPVTTKMIEQSKLSGFETTVNNVVIAAEDNCRMQLLNGETITNEYTFTDAGVTPSLELKGNLPNEGNIFVDSNCNSFVSVSNENFSATKKVDTDKIKVTKGNVIYDTFSNGDIVYFNPETATECTVTDYTTNVISSKTENISGCMKWYAFGDAGSSSKFINLLLDHNTTAITPWNTSGINSDGPTKVLEELTSDTKKWSTILNVPIEYNITQKSNNGSSTYTLDYSGYKARLISGNEIAAITGNSVWSQSDLASNIFYLENNAKTALATCSSGNITNCKVGWLSDRTSPFCATYGCANNALFPPMTFGYWTSSALASSADSAYDITISNAAMLVYSNTTSATSFGVRPVITVLKNMLS